LAIAIAAGIGTTHLADEAADFSGRIASSGARAIITAPDLLSCVLCAVKQR
jgi:hypothetical protein